MLPGIAATSSATVGALVIREAAVDVGGDLRASPGRLRPSAVRGFESGELAGGEDGFGGVPVGLVTGVAGLGVGAEDLAGVVGVILCWSR